jgi:hypothetical protein
MDKSHLYVQDEHSCMASAVNYYFDEKLFESGDDFYQRQKDLILGKKKVHVGAHSILLLGVVEKGKHVFQRVNDYTHGNKSLSNWPIKLTTRHKRVIIDYYATRREEGHVEAAEYREGRWRYLAFPESSVLPYTNMTLEEYQEHVIEKPELHLNIFHYVRNQ